MKTVWTDGHGSDLAFFKSQVETNLMGEDLQSHARHPLFVPVRERDKEVRKAVSSIRILLLDTTNCDQREDEGKDQTLNKLVNLLTGKGQLEKFKEIVRQTEITRQIAAKQEASSESHDADHADGGRDDQGHNGGD
jgi:hypothetical protein